MQRDQETSVGVVFDKLLRREHLHVRVFLVRAIFRMGIGEPRDLHGGYRQREVLIWR